MIVEEIPADVEILRNKMIEKLKQKHYNDLSPTDYINSSEFYVTEEEIAKKNAILADRQAIRTNYLNKKQSLIDCNTIGELNAIEI